MRGLNNILPNRERDNRTFSLSQLLPSGTRSPTPAMAGRTRTRVPTTSTRPITPDAITQAAPRAPSPDQIVGQQVQAPPVTPSHTDMYGTQGRTGRTAPDAMGVPGAPGTYPGAPGTQIDDVGLDDGGAGGGGGGVGSPQYTQAMTGYAENIDGILRGYDDLSKEVMRMSDEHAAAVGAQYEFLIQGIDKIEADLRSHFESQMTEEDPAIQAAMSIIKQAAEEQRGVVLEELNARGIVQSGVYMESLDRIGRGEMSAIEQFVSQRFGDLQNQLNQAIMGLSSTRLDAISYRNTSLDQGRMHYGDMATNIGAARQGAAMQGQGLIMQDEHARMQDATQRWAVGQQTAASRYAADAASRSSQMGGDPALDFQREMYGDQQTKSGVDHFHSNVLPTLRTTYNSTSNTFANINDLIQRTVMTDPQYTDAAKAQIAHQVRTLLPATPNYVPNTPGAGSTRGRTPRTPTSVRGQYVQSRR